MKPSTSVDARRVRALEQIVLVLRWTAAVVATMFVVWLLGDVLLLVLLRPSLLSACAAWRIA